MNARTANTARLLSKARTRIASFEKKPARPGSPAMAATATVNVQNVTRHPASAGPPILKMSCSWWHPRITEPAPRKRSALKKACVVRWNIAAPTEPSPNAATM